MKNVVIIIIDALRTKNLSLFGYNKETDKNIKEIAKESVLFRNFFSVTNSTFPTITSLFAGSYPKTHGIMHQAPYASPEAYEIGKDMVKEKNEKLFPSAKQMVDLAIDKIKEAENLQKPFFLFMHFEETHFPYPNVPNPEPSGENDIKEVLEKMRTDSQREYFKKRIVDIELNSVKDMKNKYDLAIKSVDEEIGRLKRFLVRNKNWEETLFIILSDHGDCLDEHGVYFSHDSLFDESVHVPLIIKMPKSEFKGKEIHEFAQTPDIAPTIIEEFEEKVKLEGKSLLQLIKNDLPIRDKVFLVDGLAPKVRAIRTKKRKLIIASENRCNLCKAEHHDKIEEYDLGEDPGETKNIYSGRSELMKF